MLSLKVVSILFVLGLVGITAGFSHTSGDFIINALKWHNIYRRMHGVPRLLLSEELVDLAQQEAERLAALGKLELKRIELNGQQLGVNLAMVSGVKNLTGNKLKRK
jgi:hypothetical protein